MSQRVIVLYASLVVTVIGCTARPSRPEPADSTSITEIGEPPESSPAKQWKEFASSWSGVHCVGQDADAKIIYVVGKTTIFEAFPPAEARKVARERAELSAYVDFTEWLGGNETDSKNQGHSGSHDNTHTTDSKAAAPTGEESFVFASECILRGLRLVHETIDAEDGVLCRIYVWDRELAQTMRNAGLGRRITVRDEVRTTASQSISARFVNGTKIEESSVSLGEVDAGEMTHCYENGAKMLCLRANADHLEETAWYENGQTAGIVVETGRHKKTLHYYRNGQLADQLETDDNENAMAGGSRNDSARTVAHKFMDPAPDPTEELMDDVVAQGPGIHCIKRDGKGRLRTLLVVAEASIDTAKAVAEGKETARNKAVRNAQNQFSAWIAEAVVVCKNATNETTLFVKSDGNKQAIDDAGNAIEINSESGKRIMARLVRELRLLHLDIRAEDKTYTVVYGWMAATGKETNHNDATPRHD